MTLLDFYRRFRPRTYTDSWHLEYMCYVISRCLVEGLNGIFEAPPRHSKSELLNVYGPAWYLLDHPTAHFGLVCNSDTLATKFSVATKAIIMSPEYQKAFCRTNCVRIAANSGRLIHPTRRWISPTWPLELTASLDPGFGFSVLILDDLLKSGKEAKSDLVREGVWDNVASAAINRLSPDGIVLACQARLHTTDTIGKLLSTEDAQ